MCSYRPGFIGRGKCFGGNAFDWQRRARVGNEIKPKRPFKCNDIVQGTQSLSFNPMSPRLVQSI